ncbi:MAG: alpha-galactosidase [Anaerolineae bacterium]
MTDPATYETRQGVTAFGRDPERGVWLQRLWGLTCGDNGDDAGPDRARGLGILDSDQGRYEAGRWSLTDAVFDEERVVLSWTLTEGLVWTSTWSLSSAAATWRRSDTVVNAGEAPLLINRCLARFPFSPARYEVYSQRSSWCNENQGTWQELDHGSLQLTCRGGRTTQGSTPYLLLQETESRQAVAFHVLPRGNWVIKARTCVAGGDSRPLVVIELGLADDTLALELKPGASLALPEILIQHVEGGQPEAGAPHLHRYAQARQTDVDRRALPIVYNTWFDAFDRLDVDRLHRQLSAAREVGCEVFVIDAGWYGTGSGSWSRKAGDWRENQDEAFKGEMLDFADAVRDAGLGFGLWMEPERNHPSVPAVQAHPGWFLPGANGYVYPDLAQPAAYHYIRSEMARLIDTYGLAWMKVDFNFELGDDPSELSRYYERWYRLLDELRTTYPHVIFEGCASGGMRSDLNTVSHVDCHFLSDTVHPVDVLRIRQGALLRLPPAKLGSWIVLRSVGKTIPEYGASLDQAPASVVTPCGAVWRPSETVDVDFAAGVAMAGVLGLSGDLAGLPQDARARLRRHLAFYKPWRQIIADATAYLLTPVRPKEDRTGWVALQLQGLKYEASLVFAYRLDDGTHRRWLRLQGLHEDTSYQVNCHHPRGSQRLTLTGRALMTNGLPVTLAERYSAAIYVVTPHQTKEGRA